MDENEVWVVKKLIEGEWVNVSVSFNRDELEKSIKLTKQYFGGEFKVVKRWLTSKEERSNRSG